MQKVVTFYFKRRTDQLLPLPLVTVPLSASVTVQVKEKQDKQLSSRSFI